MSNIPSANQKIQVEATQYLKPTSESLLQTMGGSINYTIDAIATETTNRINGDNALDARLDAIQYFQQTGTSISEISGTINSPLIVGEAYTSIAIPDNQEHLYTVIMEPNTPTAGGGWVSISVYGTAFSGQVITFKRIDELKDFYNDNGVNGGIGATIYIPAGSVTFPNTATLRLSCWNANTSFDYRVVRRSWTVETGA